MKANAILVRCSDPRVSEKLSQTEIRNELNLSLLENDCDGLISNTGSIGYYKYEKNLSDLFQQLEILVEHFNHERIILLQHTDCGFYKKSNRDEEKYYFEDLEEFMDATMKKYPNLEITGYLLNTESGALKEAKRKAFV